ncbi:S-formylglutathione hydrolase FrmB [Tenacibaculum gallaicum]|uniref:S-formylglutathione hydrolase FrmB n=1 Tax=Tenacibaculum gallaicum TaxID=561505 RepID=A0A3E0I8P4_9FLAO|nr:alpha/beta hydrolase family protein [Tenacibaculum gallaicum]REH54971.1 S-formylglutathione hydrolase FrmB [Tenacibaculum gallaicum]
MKNSITVLAILSIFCQSFSQQVDTLNVYSQSMQRNIKTLVIRPNNTIKKSVPSIYILHGYSGYPERTIKKDIPSLLRLSQEMQTLFILPDGNYDSWYIDSETTNSKYETFIASELVSYIDEHYNTDNSKTAIVGWSMGGHGALYIGARHQDLFEAIGSICGAIDFSAYGKDYGVPKLLGKDNKNWANYTAASQIMRLKNSKQKILISCGINDFLIKQNRDLHQKLNTLNIPHIYEERPGEHNAAYWSKVANTQLFHIDNFFKESN